MPYYKWRGINLYASYCTGKLFARNIQELEQLLLRQDIALTKVTKDWLQLPVPISRAYLTDILKQLAILLKSDILLPQALTLVGEQVAHARMQKVMLDIGEKVKQGIRLSDALKMHSSLFTAIIVHMVRVGEQMGCIGDALEALSAYLDMANAFAKKIKAAAMMPFFTLCAFFVIATGIIIGIVPRFALLFSSMGKELPEVTQHLMAVSSALQSPLLWCILSGVVVVLIGMYKLLNKQLKPHKDRLLLCLPIINMVVVDSALLYWLHALSMLLKSRVPLVPALHIVHPLVYNTHLKASFAPIADDVATGNTLRVAMMSMKTPLFTPDVLALIQIGQESGNLGEMVGKAADIHYAKVERTLAFCTVIIQPLLLIIMGLLVAFLVFALYMPIFNLAQIG